MSDAERITVAVEDAGQRLDSYLAHRLSGSSRAQIQRAIENGDITVNEADSKSSYKVRPGDEVFIEIPPSLPLDAVGEAIPLNIVFEDEHLIVVNKPAGMVVHPGAGIASGTLANALVYHFGEHQSPGESHRPGIVHRLDVGTSGLIVVARTDLALQRLSEQFAERKVKKTYTALIFGTVSTTEGVIDQPIGRDPKNRVKMSVRPVGSGRSALTLYRVLDRLSDFTLLEVEIKTGRTHQIRVHLAFIKHPVVGDALYDNGRGRNLANAPIRGAINHLGRPFLHASSLSFTHPVTGEQMSFKADLPAELKDFLSRLRKI
jgi:23S rRNA pseudouridine1911/1915/1917 synthase